MISLLIVSSAYIAAQMISDIASLRIITIAGFSMDAGTLIYPFTFTLRDMIHKTGGIRAARTLIICAAVINLIMAGMFWLVGQLPADPSIGDQLDFVKVLSPVWRIVFASIIAEVLAELIDTEVYRLWTQRITRRFEWMRVLSSNTISIPIDSFTFAWCAFGGVYPDAVVWSIVLSNIILKGITTIISIPGIYFVKEQSHLADDQPITPHQLYSQKR